jgi:hypothetical protein
MEVVLVLSRWDEAYPAVQAPVVGPVDVPHFVGGGPLGDGDPQVVDALPGPLVLSQLGLGKRLLTSASASYESPTLPTAGDHAGLGQPLGVPRGNVLVTPCPSAGSA